MEHKKTSIENFLSLDGQIIDVRSPKEFEQGHIPGAWNLPLFSDVERAQVGLAYKLQGPSKAVQVGLKFVGPKLSGWVAQIRKRKMSSVQVYCAGGGMRSQSLLWLLNFCRIPARSLIRGYKNYRSWVLNSFEKSYSFKVVGGHVGAKVCDMMVNLKSSSQVLDLKKLSQVSGDFLAELPFNQPTREQFENELAHTLSQFNREQSIWVQDENYRLGDCIVPSALYDQMQAAPLYFIQCNRATRLQNLVDTYGQQESSKLIAKLSTLKKYSGLKASKLVIQKLKERNLTEAFDALLESCDATYESLVKKRLGTLIPIRDSRELI